MKLFPVTHSRNYNAKRMPASLPIFSAYDPPTPEGSAQHQIPLIASTTCHWKPPRNQGVTTFPAVRLNMTAGKPSFLGFAIQSVRALSRAAWLLRVNAQEDLGQREIRVDLFRDTGSKTVFQLEHGGKGDHGRIIGA